MEAASAPSIPTRQKELGAFYTPMAMAAKLAEWAVRFPQDKVLDPSFGGRVFLDAAADRLGELGQAEQSIRSQLFGVDIDESALEGADASAHGTLFADNLILGDFLSLSPNQLPRFDAVVGNPPYIRYQSFTASARRARDLAAAAGVRLSGLSSSWAPFVVHAVSFLSQGGRMAQVLPAEILHAQYAAEVVAFLERSFRAVTFVAFEDRVFPGAQEEVVLLFADGFGASEESAARVISFPDLAGFELAGVDAPLETVVDLPNGRGQLLSQLLPTATQELLASLSRDEQIEPFGAIASVDIGVVTGANEFFVLSREASAEIDDSLLRPAVSKAVQVSGARLTDADHRAILEAGGNGLILVAENGIADVVLTSAAAHIAMGESKGFHRRYKCRIRDPWWRLPVAGDGVPALLLTYCSNDHPRLVLNEAEVMHTNTIHGVRVTGSISPAALAGGFYNSLTLLSAELVGRSYGGGVLKLEPSEAEGLMLPPVSSALEAVLPEVDIALRERNLGAVLDLVDPIVLGGLGLDSAQVTRLREGRQQLRDRRKRRSRAAT